MPVVKLRAVDLVVRFFYHKIHQLAQEIVTQRIFMFCGECGTQNPDTNSFCHNCGKPLRKRESPIPSGAVAPVQQPAAAPVQQPAAAPVQQPAAAPAQQPAAAPVQQPAAAPVQQPATAPVQQPATAPVKQRNWLGAFSIVLGIVSWLAYPYLLSIAAIALGGYSAYRIKNATGKIAILSVIGIAIAVASMVVDNFYFVLFPVDVMDLSYLGSSLLLVLK